MSRITPTKYMQELKAKMIEDRKIAESTANTYISNLVLLNEKQAFNNLGFLKKRKAEIMEHLTQYSDNTEMNYLSCIVSALSTRKEEHLYKTIYKFYQGELNDRLGKRDEVDTSVKTETQKENWLTWLEVMERWNELKDEVDKFKGDKSITKRNYETLLNFLVLSLYVLIPPRRNKDYLHMYVLLKNDGRPLEPEIKNYLNVADEEMIFNCYKTAKHYGTQVEKIPENLMDVIRIWLKFHPLLNGVSGSKPREVKLFVSVDGSPVHLDNFITYRLNRIFDRKVASTMLRHIYITSQYGEEYEKMVKTAKAMGHSVSEQKDYIKKD